MKKAISIAAGTRRLSTNDVTIESTVCLLSSARAQGSRVGANALAEPAEDDQQHRQDADPGHRRQAEPAEAAQQGLGGRAGPRRARAALG
ncbi:MAG: hypothetical protein OXP07_06930 [Defluviicoccus sp.]|nr:hypothetical protein [Defluviicoccus sp.]